MLLCLHLGARNTLDASQICNGVDITMCTVHSNVNIITMLVCIGSLPIAYSVHILSMLSSY